MTTTQFAPNALAPFQFTAELDGQLYTVLVTWNVYRRGYYVNVTDQNGVLITCRALVGSTDNYTISLVAGYFRSTMAFYDGPQIFVVNP